VETNILFIRGLKNKQFSEMAEAEFSVTGQIQMEKVLKIVDGDFLLIHRPKPAIVRLPQSVCKCQI
jgi:hypothetical protein